MFFSGHLIKKHLPEQVFDFLDLKTVIAYSSKKLRRTSERLG